MRLITDRSTKSLGKRYFVQATQTPSLKPFRAVAAIAQVEVPLGAGDGRLAL